MTFVDLTGIPLVDNHCHSLYRVQRPADVAAWHRLFTESDDPGMARTHVATTVFYQRLLRDMALFLGCEPVEDAVLAARAARGGDELIRALCAAANIGALLVDEGYPPQDRVLPTANLGRLIRRPVAPILRLETTMERLIMASTTLPEVIEALRAILATARDQGYVALKSIVAYRTGLDIRRWPDDDARAAFLQARREGKSAGAIRVAHKPLLDTLLHAAFGAAAQHELPVQFHAGYGDRDADMLRANPLHLRGVLEDPAYRAMPVVLLHGCYPYTREGAYLAAIYERVYLDLSYGIPFLSRDEMVQLTRAACGVAPLSKLLYSSDGVGVAELHWIGALSGRRVLGQVLGELVAQDELDRDTALALGGAILRDNAIRLYGLPAGA